MTTRPPTLAPGRYHLEVELGFDGDVQEWLAADQSLERPVLIRAISNPSPERGDQFLRAVRAAAAVSHNHLADIFEAGWFQGSVYSVSEWTGGMTLADRTSAHEPVSSEEFLPNASGLASALAAMHQVGTRHGHIDESAIYFAAAHPAKLAAFGRVPVATTFEDDTRMLAETLERSLTGRPAGTVLPSQLVDGVDETVDTALTVARTGRPDAAALASSLQSAPSHTVRPRAEPRWSWRWLVPVAMLTVVTVGLVIFGASLVASDSGRRSVPTPTQPPPLAVTTPPDSDPPSTPPGTDTAPVAGGSVTAVSARSVDPFGDGEEHDELATAAIDGDFETQWRTESYLDPLPRLKAGVGLAIEVQGVVDGVQASGIRDGTAWNLYWAAGVSTSLEDWSLIANGTVCNGRLDADVPQRENGAWLIWFTDVPASPDGTFNSSIGEVRFRP